ncbi:MAG: hypothetical protein ABW006_09485 [Hyphomicrobium sp.]
MPPLAQIGYGGHEWRSLFVEIDESRESAVWGKMLLDRPSTMVLVLLVIAALTGCAGNSPELPTPGSVQPTLSPQAPPQPPTPVASSMATTPANGEEPRGVPVPGAIGSATEIYSHIATGAMACWFSANGPLKKDYIFHAMADAPSRGGKAEVTIHRRDPSQPNPRGAKAYVVEIQPTGEASATVRADNRQMPDAYASAMTSDLSQWIKGEQGCSLAKTIAAETAPSEEAAPKKPAKVAKKTKKPKVKAAQAKPAATAQQAQP